MWARMNGTGGGCRGKQCSEKIKMLNTQIGPELKLSNNHRLRFRYRKTDGTLSVELLAPRTLKDGHGYTYTAGVLLAGDKLATFVAAIASLQGEPILRMVG